MNYKLSPSDLTFLYDGCKHCFVLKVKHGITQPSKPIPGVFSIIAALQKEYFSGKRLEELCLGAPSGTIKYGEKKVVSNILKIPGCESTCYISGRFDIIAELDDGSFAVLDLKTGNPSDEKTAMYARQLHSYALALENSAPNAFDLNPISKLGLIYFTPDECKNLDLIRQKLEGPIYWVEIKRNDHEFSSFLKEVVSLLDGTLPEIQADICDWCKYRYKTAGLKKEKEYQGQTGDIKKPILKCPICNSDMLIKSGKFGDFWSCVKYPDCKGTRNI